MRHLPLASSARKTLPLLRVEARLLAAAGPVDVAEQPIQARLAKPRHPLVERRLPAAHDLGDPLVSFLPLQHQPERLEALPFPGSRFVLFLFHHHSGVLVGVDRPAAAGHPPIFAELHSVSITKWYHTRHRLCLLRPCVFLALRDRKSVV